MKEEAQVWSQVIEETTAANFNTYNTKIRTTENKRHSLVPRERHTSCMHGAATALYTVHRATTKRSTIQMHKHAYIHRQQCTYRRNGLKTKNGKIENYESMLQSVNDATSNRTDVNLEIAWFLLLSTSSPSHCHQLLCCRLFLFIFFHVWLPCSWSSLTRSFPVSHPSNECFSHDNFRRRK